MRKILAALLLWPCLAFSQNVFNGAQFYAPVNFGQQSGQITLDLSKSGAFQVTATGNIYVTGPVGFPVNVAGDFTLAVTQGPNGNYVPVFGPSFSVPSSVTFSATPGVTDVLSFHLINGMAKLVSNSALNAGTSTLPDTAITTANWPGCSTLDCMIAATYAAANTLTTTTGQIKYVTNVDKTITTTIQGRYLDTQVIPSSASTTGFTTGASTYAIDLEMVCAGASGAGAASNAAGNGTVGAGGGAGAYLFAGHVAVSPSTRYGATLPLGGAATSGGTNGNAPASACTVGPINAVTYTAPAGVPGNTRATAATVGVATQGGPTAIATNGDVNGAGASGEQGMLFAAAGAGGYSGDGGSTVWGAGGNRVNATADGGACVGFGSGGGGALSGSGGAAHNGAAGCPPLLYVKEYSGAP